MKQQFGTKTYNTETAKEIGNVFTEDIGYNDFNYMEETLYQTHTGEYFLYGCGGPNTIYSKITETGNRSFGERIIPLTDKEAELWLRGDLEVFETKSVIESLGYNF